MRTLPSYLREIAGGTNSCTDSSSRPLTRSSIPVCYRLQNTITRGYTAGDTLKTLTKEQRSYGSPSLLLQPRALQEGNHRSKVLWQLMGMCREQRAGGVQLHCESIRLPTGNPKYRVEGPGWHQAAQGSAGGGSEITGRC